MTEVVRKLIFLWKGMPIVVDQPRYFPEVESVFTRSYRNSCPW